MRLGTRIFCCYLIILGACFSYPVHWILENLRTRYMEGVEDPLADQANILAAMVGADMETGEFTPARMQRIFDAVYARALSARIYTLDKTNVDARVYLTDADGRLVFDSQGRDPVGADYGDWRDVHLTLDGRYGARTTRTQPENPASAELYVAAPITVNGHLAGVLTVAKPTTNINGFLARFKPQFYKVVASAALLAVVLSYLVARWLTRPIQDLKRYAEAVGQGLRMPFPQLGRSEIGQMGRAFQHMQEALEGKKYVEQYVQNLTHEIKSPLSAIRGAAELLTEEMPAQRRKRFLANIRSEARRIRQIIDRMLRLAALENQKTLQNQALLAVRPLLETVLESRRPLLARKEITVEVNIQNSPHVRGDGFLLHQTLANLVQNAIDFSPAKGRLVVNARSQNQLLRVSIEDEGPGIPAYATAKIFDKFFSLQRPDSGKKSTGLGLNFVQQVAQLHGGWVEVANRTPQGVRAELILPAAKGCVPPAGRPRRTDEAVC